MGVKVPVVDEGNTVNQVIGALLLLDVLEKHAKFDFLPQN